MAKKKKKKATIKLDSKRKEFERQPDDTDKAWEGFVIYRDMGATRTLLKTAEVYQKRHGLKSKLESTHCVMQKWSSIYLWATRSAAWDNELDRIRRRKQVHEIEEMRTRHLNLAQSLQGLGAVELNKWLKKVKKSKDSDTTELTTHDVRALIDLGIRLERLNRDEPESVTKTQNEIDISTKRERMRKLLEDKEVRTEIRNLAERLTGHEDSE